MSEKKRKSVECEFAQKQFLHDPYFRQRTVSLKKQFKRKPKYQQREYEDEIDTEELDSE